MVSQYDALSGQMRANPTTVSGNPIFTSVPKPTKIITPGGVEANTVPTTHGIRGGGGLLSDWVNRPNRIPQLQAYFQKNAGGEYIHRLGPKDAMINRGILAFTLVGGAFVLYTFASLSLGVNKKPPKGKQDE